MTASPLQTSADPIPGQVPNDPMYKLRTQIVSLAERAGNESVSNIYSYNSGSSSYNKYNFLWGINISLLVRYNGNIME